MLGKEVGQLQRPLAQVGCQPKLMFIVESCGASVLQVAVGVAALPEILGVLFAAPLLHHEVDQEVLQLGSVMQPVDLNVAHRAKLHHDVVGAVLYKLIVSEDELLLALCSGATEVSPVACYHRPGALLHHEVHQLHCPLPHVVLAFRTPALEVAHAELDVAVVRICLGWASFPLLLEEAGQLLVDPLRVGAIDLDVADLTELDHDQRRDQVQRVGRLELHLLLPVLSCPAQVARIADLQGPATLVGHELSQLHCQLAHVVLSFRAACLVGTISARFPILRVDGSHGPALLTKVMVLLQWCDDVIQRVPTAEALLLLTCHHP
mmetsp:Transcript_41067/g.91846  ORF Transcript_41067/g.91846 Transcript_41067/m.91846 type:complete len:321 (-) Transcript_41067:305-1267(-)